MNAPRTIVITGGAGAVGSAIARRCMRDGARVALLDRDPERAEAAANDLGPGAIGLPCDVVQPEQTAAAINQAAQTLGGIDWLIAAAGLTQVSPAHATAPSVYHQVMAVNFFGLVHAVIPALPYLRARKGAITALSSVAGFAPLLARSGYCASKHAVHGYCNTLRAELASDGVHVLLACPAFIDSDFARQGLGAKGQSLEFDRTTTGTLLRPDDVAAKIHRAMSRRQDCLLIGRAARLAWWTSRLAPRFYARKMAARFANDMRE